MPGLPSNSDLDNVDCCCAQASSPEEAHLLDSRLLQWSFNQPDSEEGVQSFVEKRTPNFRTTGELPDHFPVRYFLPRPPRSQTAPVRSCCLQWWGEVDTKSRL